MRIACLNAVFQRAKRFRTAKKSPREVEVTVKRLTPSARDGLVKQHLPRQPENARGEGSQASGIPHVAEWRARREPGREFPSFDAISPHQ